MGVKKKSASAAVLRRIRAGDKDRLWTYVDFKDLPTLAVAATLSRLAKKDVIRRIRKGVYYLPKVTRFGESAPDAGRVATAVLKTRGVSWVPTGPAAFNGLGLTTQVSPTLTLAVDRNVRTSWMREGRLRLRLRPASGLRGIRPEERALLDALRDIKSIPNASPLESLARIGGLFRSHKVSFERLVRHATVEPPRVRALLGAIGEELGEDKKLLAKLHASLNPTTSFRLGVSDRLPTADNWNIQ